jgi:Uma2 family endonuclease
MENGNYEFRNGVIVAMQPTGYHEEIVGFLAIELTLNLTARDVFADQRLPDS